MITAVITSFNRFDLLKQTIASFTQFYPHNKIIIIDDSGDPAMHQKIRRDYSKYRLILNEANTGLVESIDKAYAEVATPYIWHTEDDFDYFRGGFVEKCIKVMESDPMICRVGIRGKSHIGMLMPEILMAGDAQYRLAKDWPGNLWHGFGFQCGLIRKASYDVVKPYTQYSTPENFITIRECLVGQAYHDLGYKAVSLAEDYVKHTGGRRSTYGLKMEA